MFLDLDQEMLGQHDLDHLTMPGWPRTMFIVTHSPGILQVHRNKLRLLTIPSVIGNGNICGF